MDLFDPQGRRLYVTAAERAAFLAAEAKAPRKVRSLCLTLHYTEEKKGSVTDEIHSHVTPTLLRCRFGLCATLQSSPLTYHCRGEHFEQEISVNPKQRDTATRLANERSHDGSRAHI
jgi:hypothetical protein